MITVKLTPEEAEALLRYRPRRLFRHPLELDLSKAHAKIWRAIREGLR